MRLNEWRDGGIVTRKPTKEVSSMKISRRMGVAISGLAFTGAAVTTLGAAGSASAQTVTAAPQHSVTGYSVVDKHRHWRSGGWTYEYWSWGSCGCGCC
jgi:hypothetical protein